MKLQGVINPWAKIPRGPALVGGSVCLCHAAGAALVQEGQAVPVPPGGFRTTSETAWARFLKSDDRRVMDALPSPCLQSSHSGAVQWSFS